MAFEGMEIEPVLCAYAASIRSIINSHASIATPTRIEPWSPVDDRAVTPSHLFTNASPYAASIGLILIGGSRHGCRRRFAS